MRGPGGGASLARPAHYGEPRPHPHAPPRPPQPRPDHRRLQLPALAGPRGALLQHSAPRLPRVSGELRFVRLFSRRPADPCAHRFRQRTETQLQLASNDSGPACGPPVRAVVHERLVLIPPGTNALGACSAGKPAIVGGTPWTVARRAGRGAPCRPRRAVSPPRHRHRYGIERHRSGRIQAQPRRRSKAPQREPTH